MHWTVERIYNSLFLFAAALMTTIAIVAVATIGAANPAFIVCGAGALLMGSITVMNQAMRPAKHKLETDQLTEALRRALQAGDV